MKVNEIVNKLFISLNAYLIYGFGFSGRIYCFSRIIDKTILIKIPPTRQVLNPENLQVLK